MSDLIDRTVLVDMLQHIGDSTLSEALEEMNLEKAYLAGALGKLREKVVELPTIDAVPVVHGRWIEKPFLLGTTNVCSRCGDYFGMPHGEFKFCPTCGAKMDAKVDAKDTNVPTKDGGDPDGCKDYCTKP